MARLWRFHVNLLPPREEEARMRRKEVM